MLTSLFKAFAFLFFIICCLSSYGQLPTNNLLYLRSPTGTEIYNYDPVQPVSTTNPSVNTIHLPGPPGHGLAICEVLGSGNSILTFYTIVDDKYWYYDPFAATWVNTHHQTASGGIAVNFGGGGGFIFNFDAIGGNVYKYDGTTDGSLLLHVPGYGGLVGSGGVADVVVDCEGNWYIMMLFPGNNNNSYLRKYNSAGTLLQYWSISNPNNFTSGPGFGIVNNRIYLLNQITNPTGLSIPSASLGTSTIDFTTIPALLPVSTLNDDMGSVPATGGTTITPTINITTPDNPVCQGTAVTFTSMIGNGGSNPTYQWFVNGVAIAGATSPTFNFTPDNGDTITCLLVSAAQTCNLTTAVLSNAVTMDVLAPVDPILQYNPSVFCKNASQGIPMFSPAGGTFSVSPEGLTIDMNTGIVDPDASDTGTYIVTYTAATVAGCIPRSIQDTVTIVPLPMAQINTYKEFDDLCLGDAFSLFASPEEGCVYEWKPLDYFPDNNTGAEITARVIASSDTIYLTVINSAGCINTDTILLKAKSCCDVFVPNAFSPDNDGLNDEFKMYSKSNALKDINFSVYSRWGEKVFSTSNQLSGWNGMYNNERADVGAYFYYLNYTCVDGTKKTIKGEVVLIR